MHPFPVVIQPIYLDNIARLLYTQIGPKDPTVLSNGLPLS